MVDEKALDVGQLWVIPNKAWVKTLLYITPEEPQAMAASKPKSMIFIVGGPEGECTLEKGEGFHLEGDILNRTSRIMTDNLLLRIRGREYFPGNKLPVWLLCLNDVRLTEGHDI